MGISCLNELVARGVPPEFVVPPNRDHKSRETMIKASHGHNIPVVMFDHQPTEERFVKRIQELAPDLILVSGFSHLIPEPVYSSARIAAINAHPSLLPEYRGANPYYHVIANGEKETGVTLHMLDSKFDTGNILAQTKVAISPRETMGTLGERLSRLAANKMSDLVEQIMRTGLPESTKQKANTQFRANRIVNWDIDWSLPSIQIDRRIRALNPYYRAIARLGQTTVAVFSGAPIQISTDSPPGEVVAVDDQGVHISTGEGVYCIRALYFGLEWLGDAAGAVANKLLCIGDRFSMFKQTM